MNRLDDKQPWYADGLQFSCTRCGNCCGGEPGYVWVNKDEIEALARRFELTPKEFRRQYTVRVKNRGISLSETGDFDCIFYDREQGCTVYEDRPQQCRTWPFWRRVVASPTTWKDAARDCPGMNQGSHYDLVQIRSRLAKDGLR